MLTHVSSLTACPHADPLAGMLSWQLVLWTSPALVVSRLALLAPLSAAAAVLAVQLAVWAQQLPV